MGEDDKREGADDLFEDLDKFFAPIKDVDWPEPADPAVGAESPAKETGSHVAVHAGPPAGSHRPEEGASGSQAPTEPETGAGEAGPEPSHAVWHDTAEIEAVAAGAEGDEDDDVPIVIHDESEAEAEEIASDEPEPEPEPLFVSEAVLEQWAEQPSEEDVEAAAEHFAESMRDERPPGEGPERTHESPEETEGPDLPADVGAGEIEEDILSDLEGPSEPQTVKVGGEGLGGPSWQDPTSMEVGADLERRGERDVPVAAATGIVLAALAFGALLAGRLWFAILVFLIVLVAQGELFGVMHKHHKQPATAVGLATGGLVLFGAYNWGEGAVLAMTALGVMATFLWFMAVPAIHRKETLVNVGLTAFNIAYIPLLGSFLLLTLRLGPDGKSLVFAIVLLTFGFDTSAFLSGSFWGGSRFQRALAPDTSPKKSWEGLIVAVLVTVILSLAILMKFVGPFEDEKMKSVLVALVVSVAATFGDLAESLIKRDLGIKDMGNVLPGHGGVLDRIDSLLFTAPAAYLLFRALFS